jgi:hypothetical protein
MTTHRPPCPPDRRPRRANSSAAAVALAVVMLGGLGPAARPAHAQWGWGGWGWGGGGQIANRAIFSNINARSASAANYAYSIRQHLPGSGNVYAGNPNAFVNHMRDTSFYQTYNVSTRRATGEPVAASAGLTATDETPTRGRQTLPLERFFSAAGVLVWPSEAPKEGRLGESRATADQAAAAVYQEVKARGFAPVGLISDARTKVVEYGRPALTYLREHTTAAVVESFHQFLLGLYDALGAAGTPSTGAARR